MIFLKEYLDYIIDSKIRQLDWRNIAFTSTLIDAYHINIVIEYIFENFEKIIL